MAGCHQVKTNQSGRWPKHHAWSKRHAQCCSALRFAGLLLIGFGRRFLLPALRGRWHSECELMSGVLARFMDCSGFVIVRLTSLAGLMLRVSAEYVQSSARRYLGAIANHSFSWRV